MSILRYFAIQCCALIGFFIGIQLLPHYDEIMYPFSPDFSLLWQFYQILFSLGFLSMATALIGSWVYKKTIVLFWRNIMHCTFKVTVKSFWCKRTHNKSLKQDKKQLVFAPSSLILTNYFLPLNEALCAQIFGWFYFLRFGIL